FFRKNEGKIIHIKHESAIGALFIEIGTEGKNIHKSIETKEDEIIVTKNFSNSFKYTNLKEILDEINIKSFIIVGSMSHM
ncbi:isochorismatase family protein, partial [Aliarcobacter butzleri]|uniref:isochorismatase family protein n=1 Tax=Aliarcobacter butzleri TaxID=28197 RepID=UPI003B21D34C